MWLREFGNVVRLEKIRFPLSNQVRIVYFIKFGKQIINLMVNFSNVHSFFSFQLVYAVGTTCSFCNLFVHLLWSFLGWVVDVCIYVIKPKIQ